MSEGVGMKNTRIRWAGIGTAGFVTLGVATVVAATTASAQMSVSQSSAYCVGSTYTITLPVADQTALLNRAPSGYHEFIFSDVSSAGGNARTFAVAQMVTGQDLTVQWKPDVAQSTNIYAGAWDSATNTGGGLELLGPIDVVQGGPSCPAPPATGTGSASSIPVIGGLLKLLGL
ncbi:hypothetical protein ACFYTS_02945 [Nocardia sp. NPDC004151]|uniref:hypothetical protein n=1 Tax=Nocardia sp. NPDC004151 TaxID=3364304 RepID=UPI0036B6AAEB